MNASETSAAAPTEAVRPGDPGLAAEPARDPTIVHLPLYRFGTPVQYQGQTYTVDHVIISRDGLQVHLQELGNHVAAEKLVLAPSRVVLRRQ